jgi:hypothetical protein
MEALLQCSDKHIRCCNKTVTLFYNLSDNALLFFFLTLKINSLEIGMNYAK